MLFTGLRLASDADMARAIPMARSCAPGRCGEYLSCRQLPVAVWRLQEIRDRTRERPGNDQGILAAQSVWIEHQTGAEPFVLGEPLTPEYPVKF